MNLREMITKALKRLNISQPNPAQLDKGKDAVERFLNDYNNDPTINSGRFTLNLGTTEYTIKGDDIIEFPISNATVTGIVDNKKVLNLVDIDTWFANREDQNYYAMAIDEANKVTIYHKWMDLANAVAIVRKEKVLDLDSSIILPANLMNLCQLYICKDLARTAEQLQKFTAEYDEKEAQVKDNRMSLILPTRDIDNDYWSR